MILPVIDAPVHAYYGSSPSCWALNGVISARVVSEPEPLEVHQVAVDAYAVQHPGVPERRPIQSVALHLMTLCLVFERKADPREGSRLHARMAHRDIYTWLDPPSPNGHVTVADVAQAETPHELSAAVLAWGSDVWQAWGPHHDTVRRWISQSLD